MKSVLIISGWAHGIDAIKPMGDELSEYFEVQLLTGAQVLNDPIIPSVDYIVTGSMGGLLAMELLPKSCRKLVLISSTAKFCAGEEYDCGTSEKILRRMILQLKRNPEAVLAEFFKNVHFPQKESRRSILLRSAQMETPSGTTEQDAPFTLNDLLTGLEYLRSTDLRLQTPNLMIPVLLLHGSDDRIIPPSAAEWLHTHLPDSQLQIFENGGHALPAHHFRKVIHKILCFFADP